MCSFCSKWRNILPKEFALHVADALCIVFIQAVKSQECDSLMHRELEVVFCFSLIVWFFLLVGIVWRIPFDRNCWRRFETIFLVTSFECFVFRQVIYRYSLFVEYDPNRCKYYDKQCVIRFSFCIFENFIFISSYFKEFLSWYDHLFRTIHLLKTKFWQTVCNGLELSLSLFLVFFFNFFLTNTAVIINVKIAHVKWKFV